MKRQILFITSTVVMATCPAWIHAKRPESEAYPIARLALVGGNGRPASSSADGRYVAFESMAALVPADTNRVSDIYVLDRTTGQLTLESAPEEAQAADGGSFSPSLSADARWLVFESLASNLTRDRSTRVGDIFLRDRTTRRTRRVIPADRDIGTSSLTLASPAISGDGRVLAFATAGAVMPGGSPRRSVSRVYVMDIETREVTCTSLTARGDLPETATSYAPALSRDGRMVAFTSSVDLEVGDRASRQPQVYVRDLTHGVTRLVSRAANGAVSNQASYAPSISGDGRLVAFVSTASNLGPADMNRQTDVYVRNLDTNVVTLVSHTRRGKAGNGASYQPALSGDGQFVAFVSEASDLVSGPEEGRQVVDNNLLPDVYLANLRTGTIRRVSGSADRVWWSSSDAPAINEDGTTVVFRSTEPIHPRDLGNDFDLFVWRGRGMSAYRTTFSISRSLDLAGGHDD